MSTSLSSSLSPTASISSSASSSSESDCGSPRYIVDSVVSRRTNPITGVNEYLIKWKESDEKTWEPKKQLIEDGLLDELEVFDREKNGSLPARNVKRAQLLGKLLGRRSSDILANQAINSVKKQEVVVATPAPTSGQNKNTPMTSNAAPQAAGVAPLDTKDTSASVVSTQSMALPAQHPDPFEYCTPRPESPRNEKLPTFEEEEQEDVVSISPFSRPSPGTRKNGGSSFLLVPSPGKVIKNQLFATSEHSRIFVAGRRPRSVSSEGIFKSSSSSSSSSSTSTSSSSSSNSNRTSDSVCHVGGGNSYASSVSSVLSPARRDFLFRRPGAIRTPGGHLLTSVTPQPSSVKMRGGNKRRRQQVGHGLQQKGSVSFAKRIIKRDSNKFVRVITPLKKRLKRNHASSQDMTESQRERKNELRFDRDLLDSPSYND